MHHLINTFFPVWMMVIVPRIAVVSSPATIPFIYGIRHAGNLRAELLTPSPNESISSFTLREADIALLPSSAFPSLHDASLVTEYCIAFDGASNTSLLLSREPVEQVRRVFVDSRFPASVQLAGYLLAKYWKVTPDYFAYNTHKDSALMEHPQKGDAFLVEGDQLSDLHKDFTNTYDLTAQWKQATGLPFVAAVWAAHKEVDPDLVEGLQYALTFGLEHSYEAILESGLHDEEAAQLYTYLGRHIDFIFNEQKHKALRKFWDAGIKIAPRVNPG